ncbi:MAG: class I adenylate-forming enzyme family protein [Bacillota bacterium]
MNVAQALFITASRQPKHPAILHNDEVITYKQLLDDVERLAGSMAGLGIKPGDRVAIFMGNYPEYITSYFAVLTIGASVVPINPIYQSPEVSFIVNNAKAVAIIADTGYMGTLRNARFDTVKHMILAGAGEYPGALRLSDMVSCGGPGFTPIDRLPGDTAQIIYTSGTTGVPKGAMITHANLEWMSMICRDTFQLKPEDRVVCVLPLFHAYAKVQAMLTPVTAGATIILISKFEPGTVMRQMVTRKATIFFGVPTMYVMFVNSPEVEEYDFSNLRVAVSGGASIAVEVIHKVREKMGLEICEGYGLTESTVMSTMNPYHGMKKIGSIGLPIPDVQIIIVDEENQEVPAGQTGELLVRGPNIMKGYYNNLEATAAALRDGWLHTGDVASIDEDGYFYIVDRKKDMIIRGGFNVYPREIEEVIFTHSKVAEVAVIGVPDPVFGEESKAFIVLKGGEQASGNEIIEFCRSRLARYKVPKFVAFVNTIPKTSTGKIDKKALRAMNTEETGGNG